MVNYHSNFRQLLLSASDGVEVYYESFDKKEAVPCISYLESNNSALATGDTLKYSDITYQIKIWAKDISELLSISNKLDNKLTSSGFQRTTSFEQKDDGLLVKVMRYSAIGYERQ